MNEDSPLVCLGMMVADVIGRPLRALPEAGHLVLVDEMSLHTEGAPSRPPLRWLGPGRSADVVGNVWAQPLGAFLLQPLDGASAPKGYRAIPIWAPPPRPCRTF